MTVPAVLCTRRTPTRPTLGHRVAAAAELLGTPLMPHQRQIADTALEVVDPATGRHAYGLVIVTIPRQSGKTALLHALLLSSVIGRRNFRSWYTAQTGLAARKKYREMLASLKLVSLLRKPGVRDLVAVRQVAGDESWSFGDSRISIFSPQPDAIHGEATDLVCLDESWAHTLARGRELLQAASPSGATRPRQQIWIVSTAGDAGSEFLADMTATGKRLANAGATAGTAYFEWGAGAVDRSWPDEQIIEAVLAGHPARGRTISRDKILQDLDTLGMDEWLRAYGNVWAASSIRAIPAAQWAQACAHGDPAPPDGARLGVGVDVAIDRASACIAVAWDTDEGPRVKIAAHGPGVAWVAGDARALAERWAAPIGIDNYGPAKSLIDHMRRDGATVADLSAAHVATACGDLYDRLMSGTVRVAPNAPLDLAVEGAATRALGDAYAWGRKTSASDITPLNAATWALWALEHAPRGGFFI